MSRMDFSTSLSPLITTASRKVISFSDILAVNFIVGWYVLACSMKRSTSYLTVPKGKKRLQCNVSILWAWCCFVQVNLFRSAHAHEYT